MRSKEQRVRETVLPCRRQCDHVPAARTKAVEKENDLPGLSAGKRLQAGSIDDLRHSGSAKGCKHAFVLERWFGITCVIRLVVKRL